MAIHGFQKKTVLLVLFLVLFSLDVSACGLGISEEERDAVYNLIEWNLYYARVEDLNGYMWTLHPEAPGVNDTKAQMAVIFREFDLAYDIEEWEILSINDRSAQVRVVQVTRKLAGSQPFRDNRMEAVHNLRKDNTGEWKIYTSALDESSIEYLDVLTP
jgi:hypothetical protein